VVVLPTKVSASKTILTLQVVAIVEAALAASQPIQGVDLQLMDAKEGISYYHSRRPPYWRSQFLARSHDGAWTATMFQNA